MVPGLEDHRVPVRREPDNYAGALAGNALAAQKGGPLLLTDGALLPTGAGRWLHAHGSALTFIPVFGGPNAVPDTAVNQAGVQAWGAGNFDRR